jgi:hypothetical protein
MAVEVEAEFVSALIQPVEEVEAVAEVSKRTTVFEG